MFIDDKYLVPYPERVLERFKQSLYRLKPQEIINVFSDPKFKFSDYDKEGMIKSIFDNQVTLTEFFKKAQDLEMLYDDKLLRHFYYDLHKRRLIEP